MANKNDLFDFDETTAANNDNIQGANVAENCAPSGINNAIRGLAAIVKRAIGSQGSAIASAATTAIGAAGTALYATVTGTTTITSFGAVGAGTFRIVELTGSLTLTHNATSLKLPGAANIQTAAGDIGFFISLGSGNWKCLHFSRADGSAVTNFNGTLTSADPGAAAGPDFIADRSSASPAANDAIGGLVMRGRDSAANATDYARIRGKILDPTNGSEDGQVVISALANGTEADILTIGSGVQIGSPTGGDPGTGKLNVHSEIQIGGVGLASLPLQRTYDQVQGPQASSNEVIPHDDSVPLSTEGTQLFSRSITPKSATSKIRIEVEMHFTNASGAGVDGCMALFRGTTCIAVGPFEAVSTGGQLAKLTFEEVSGSTSARTYSLRYGTATASVTTVNDTAAGDYGNLTVSSMTITEYLP